ncbi:hypothetical protein EGM70_10085 [Enterobacteriaceae bacterium 89]|nr:hypothetical protein [Enterobacteriaceae bacterium 89]
MSLRIRAHVFLHDLIISHRLSRPVCQKGQQCLAAGLSVFFFCNQDIERFTRLAKCVEHDTILIHLIETGQEFAGDLLKLIFLADA